MPTTDLLPLWRAVTCRHMVQGRPRHQEGPDRDDLEEKRAPRGARPRRGPAWLEPDRQRDAVRARVAALHAELAARPADTPACSGLPFLVGARAPVTPAEKVKLFRKLFRGREDIFPRRFVSKKTGKPGYAPTCSNKFVQGVCELPKVRCSECANQAFVPVDDQVVLDHLRGRHVMGVYPLLHVPDGEERLVLATGRYIGEGVDDARLDTLFLAMPVEVLIFDYADREVPVLMRTFEKRLRTYRAIGYARGEAPLGYAEPLEEPTIEYDEEVLRHLDDTA